MQPTPVVLAGGKSTRFVGGDKLRAELRGQPIIDRVVRTVDDVFSEEPVVVCRTRDQCDAIRGVLENPNPVRFMTDDPHFSGSIAGIFGAIDVISTEWMFVVAGDMPVLSPHAISWLQHIGNAKSCHAVVPTPGPEMYEPLFAFYQCDPINHVRDKIPQDAGPRTLISALPAVNFVSLEDAPNEFDQSLANVNTKADLQELDR